MTLQIKKLLQVRPLSWSAISSFEYNPAQWYGKYVLGGKQHQKEEMNFGKKVGELLASDPTFMPQVPRCSIFEYKLKVTFHGIPLLGFIDSYEPHTTLFEYKTGKKAWDTTRAKGHGQIDMYLLMLWVKHKIRPEDIQSTIFWLPTKESGDFSISFKDEKYVKAFPVQKRMLDIMRFGQRIKDTVVLMQQYIDDRELNPQDYVALDSTA